MINTSKVLAIIPARRGSKRIPNKSMISLYDKPLIEWTFDAVKKSKYVDQIVVTSDHPEILNLSRKYNFLSIERPSNLADDYATSSDVVLHVLESIKDYDYFVLLQPTSPLRTASDIDEALETCINAKAKSCVSVCKTQESPYLMFKVSADKKLDSILGSLEIPRSQDLPPTYLINGAIYIHEVKSFCETSQFIKNETVAHEMPIARSIDIDTFEDLKFAEMTLRELK